MRLRKFLLALAVALLGSALVSASAFADGRYHGGHGGARVGVYVGPGWWGPRPYWGGPYWGGAYWAAPSWGGYYAPYYYPSYAYPPVVVQPAPQVYIERDAPPQTAPAPVTPAPQQQWWYFCPGANAYYPYVRECPGGWQRVAPQPPG